MELTEPHEREVLGCLDLNLGPSRGMGFSHCQHQGCIERVGRNKYPGTSPPCAVSLQHPARVCQWPHPMTSQTARELGKVIHRRQPPESQSRTENEKQANDVGG